LSNQHTSDHGKTPILDGKYLPYQEIDLGHDLKLGSKPTELGIDLSIVSLLPDTGQLEIKLPPLLLIPIQTHYKL
jgi:hypothetical protein